jgi:glycosyltransferase involved in cell wall biosynthesis
LSFCNLALARLIILNLKTLLYISYYFPPCGLSGVLRALKFVKYLPRHGWRPLVLCASGFRFLAEDESLLEEIPPEAVIERVDVPEPYSFSGKRPPSPRAKAWGAGLASWLSFPDTRALWIARGFRRGLEIISRESPLAILATSPPYSSLILGRKLSVRTGLPLILDYRDLWHGNAYRAYPTPIHRAWNRRAEEGVLRSASAVITINEAMARHLRESFGVSARVIPHGYDPEDFVPSPAQPGKAMRILYAGSFFRRTDPSWFLEGLRLFRQRRPDATISLTWAGIGSYPVEEMIAGKGLSDIFNHLPYIAHRESCRLMQEHDLLWVLVGKGEGPEVSTVKAYDYLGAGRAILATVPEDTDAARLIREAGGYICPPDDPESIYWALYQAYADFKRGTLPIPQNTEKYSISERAKALAELLDSLT